MIIYKIYSIIIKYNIAKYDEFTNNYERYKKSIKYHEKTAKSKKRELSQSLLKKILERVSLFK